MEDQVIYEYPAALSSIIDGTEKLGFDMASEPKTGAFLKALAASKPNGSFLEIGTGTGLSAAWILQGMDNQSTLVSVDNDKNAQNVALEHLGSDSRLKVICADGGEWLGQNQDKRYDFIFADAWPGKFSHLEGYAMALDNGGQDQGAPGIRDEVHPNFNAAYVRDPSGTKLVVVCHVQQNI